ncbi:MAG: cell division protein ZipA [Halieaceae bacterium]|nr:cell division protein ZipA [Halieaceae bacterium]
MNIDIDMLEWIIIIGTMLILIVLLDGYRRMRKDSVRMRASVTKAALELDEDRLFPSSELPNGGARVVANGNSGVAAVTGEGVTTAADAATGENATAGMDATAVTEAAAGTKETIAETEAASQTIEPYFSDFGAATEKDGENIDLLRGLSSEEPQLAMDEPQPAETQLAEDKPPPGLEPQVVIVHVMARDESGFAGQDILEVLLARDLRFGEMNFFHRHVQAAGRGRILFSVANMMKPGVFNIDSMAELSTRGLTFFLTLPGPDDMMAAFESMLETAEYVAKTLEGDLLDESRSAATRQTKEHIRQRIRELQRLQLAHDNR